MTLGTLRAGASALTLNIASGSSVTFSGGTTLTGNATFSVPTGVTVGLGTVTDGNLGFGLTKSGGGILSITSGTNYSANGQVLVTAGTLLINQPSGLPQRTVANNVVVSGGERWASVWGRVPCGRRAMFRLC